MKTTALEHWLNAEGRAGSESNRQSVEAPKAHGLMGGGYRDTMGINFAGTRSYANRG